MTAFHVLQCVCAPLPEGAGWAFKPSAPTHSEPKFISLQHWLSLLFSAENKLNTSVWVSFRWDLKTQRLSVACGDIGVLVLLSLVWVTEPGLAPDVTHSPLKRDAYLGLSSFRYCCFLASMMWPAAFTLSFSSALKSTPSNKRVCLRVKGLQIWACYLYSIIVNNSQLDCHVYDWLAIMGCVLQQLWMVFSPGCSLSQAWNPWVTWKRGDFYRLHPIVVAFSPPSLDIGSVISDVIMIPSICYIMPFQKCFSMLSLLGARPHLPLPPFPPQAPYLYRSLS